MADRVKTNEEKRKEGCVFLSDELYYMLEKIEKLHFIICEMYEATFAHVNPKDTSYLLAEVIRGKTFCEISMDYAAELGEIISKLEALSSTID